MDEYAMTMAIDDAIKAKAEEFADSISIDPSYRDIVINSFVAGAHTGQIMLRKQRL